MAENTQEEQLTTQNKQEEQQQHKSEEEDKQQQHKSEEEVETKKLEGQELNDAILSQIEFYFSQENLSSDPFLVSQMDGNKYVPLSIIVNFSKVKALSTDVPFIIEVIKTSKVVELDETNSKIKSKVLDQQRNTIILREVPSDATTEEIAAIFESFEEKPTDIRFDIGNTCFVSFSSEKTAISSLTFVKTQSLRGNAIRARIKTETILRSCNSVKAVNQPYYQYSYPPYNMGAWNHQTGRNDEHAEYRNPNNRPRNPNPNYRKRNNNSNNNNNNTTHSKENSANHNSNRRSSPNNGDRNHNPTYNNNDKRQRQPRKKQNNKTKADFQIGQSHFPPLPTAKAEQNARSDDNQSAKSWSQVLTTKTASSESAQPAKVAQSNQ